MSKNIVIYSDGTGQAGGLRPEQRLSNVYKLYRASRGGPDSVIKPVDQIAYYDPGLGSGETSFWSTPITAIRKLVSSGLGSGISENIADCYEVILKHYEQGDRIYLFGFSRGAYTARCVANVMNVCGIPVHDSDKTPLPRYGARLRQIAEEAVFKVYEHGASKNRKLYEEEREEQARRFRAKYGCEGKGPDGEAQGNVQPYFIGVFDTVAALGVSGLRKVAVYVITALLVSIASSGIAGLLSYFFGFGFLKSFIWSAVAISALIGFKIIKSRFRYIGHYPKKYRMSWHFKSWGLANYDRYLDNMVGYARHAISIDETRKSFPQVPWAKQVDMDRNAGRNPPWLRQMWFAGNHSDIGGSYAEDESRLSDIALDWMIEQVRETEFPVVFNDAQLNRFPYPNGMQHCEVKGMLESWPTWVPKFMRFTWKEKTRDGSGAKLHESVLERFKAECICDAGRTKPYRPEALRANVKVKHLYEPQVEASTTTTAPELK